MKQTTTFQMSAEEWEGLPITFDARTMARVLGCCVRYCQDHASELGGRLIGGRWIFSKPRTAALLGIEL